MQNSTRVVDVATPHGIDLKRLMDHMEAAAILGAFERAAEQGALDISGVARALNVSKRTLYHKMKRHGINIHELRKAHER